MVHSVYDRSVHVSCVSTLYVQMSSRILPVAGRRKRAQPAVSGGISGSYDDRDSNFAWYVAMLTTMKLKLIKPFACT